jgi:hypothetical protein
MRLIFSRALDINSVGVLFVLCVASLGDFLVTWIILLVAAALFMLYLGKNHD